MLLEARGWKAGQMVRLRGFFQGLLQAVLDGLYVEPLRGDPTVYVR